MMEQAVIVDNMPVSVITVDGETTTEFSLCSGSVPPPPVVCTAPRSSMQMIRDGFLCGEGPTGEASLQLIEVDGEGYPEASSG